MQILQARKPNTNVGEAERWLSLIGGSSLVAYGLARRNTAGFGLAALGGSLLWRGATGHCPMYQTLGVNTAERGYAKGTGSRAGVPYELGIRVDHEIRSTSRSMRCIHSGANSATFRSSWIICRA